MGILAHFPLVGRAAIAPVSLAVVGVDDEVEAIAAPIFPLDAGQRDRDAIDGNDGVAVAHCVEQGELRHGRCTAGEALFHRESQGSRTANG